VATFAERDDKGEDTGNVIRVMVLEALPWPHVEAGGVSGGASPGATRCAQ
jgi:hypothetical protein